MASSSSMTKAAVAIARAKIKASDIPKMGIDDLARVLREASDAYYNNGQIIISDVVFDVAQARLEHIDPDNEALNDIGAPMKGNKVKLPYWMGSLTKQKDDPKALVKWIKTYKDSYVVSDKLDGNSGMFCWDPTNGPKMYSRGNGEYGCDISVLLQYINGIPAAFKGLGKGKGKSVPIAVRGELIISKASWDPSMGANARNVVAGVLHTSSPDAAVASKVDFVVYELVEPNMKPSDAFAHLKSLGFNVVWNIVKTGLEHDDLSSILVERRKISPYEVDGIVVMHNEYHPIVRQKNPPYGFAMKSVVLHDEAEVLVTMVEWNRSKDNYLKPIVHFNTVALNGVRISKATGYNAAYIETNKIGVGSRLIIIRSNDVIPKIMRILKVAADGEGDLPEGEGSTWHWSTNHVDAIYDGDDDAELIVKQMQHFAKTLEMEGIGPGKVKQLFDGGVDTLIKFVHATFNDILGVDGFKERSANIAAEAIKKGIRNAIRDEVLLMKASNIFGRGLGETKLRLIVQQYPDLLTLKTSVSTKTKTNGKGKAKRLTVTVADLVVIEGIGATTATDFVERLPKYYAFVDSIKLQSLAQQVYVSEDDEDDEDDDEEDDDKTQEEEDGEEVVLPKGKGKGKAAVVVPPVPGPKAKKVVKAVKASKSYDFSDLKVVFTQVRDADLEKLIKENGGSVTSAFSGKTTLIITKEGYSASSTITKANDKNVPILTIKEFKDKYGIL